MFQIEMPNRPPGTAGTAAAERRTISLVAKGTSNWIAFGIIFFWSAATAEEEDVVLSSGLNTIHLSLGATTLRSGSCVRVSCNCW